MRAILPPSPDHRIYRGLLAEIEALWTHSPKEAMALFRAQAEEDFWFFQKFCTSLGRFVIQDKAHKRYGKLWIDEPWMFDRAREVQHDLQNRTHGVFYNWARGFFKTCMIVRNGSLWILARDPQETIFVFTHKVDQTGESMIGEILMEIETSEALQMHWPQFRQPLPESSGSRITLHREPGPREPSVSIHAILQSAASGHPTRIFVDDAVTDKTVESKQILEKTERQMERLAALRQDITPIVWIGTVWDEDDPNMRFLKKDRFTRRSFHPGRDKKTGEWILRSEKFFKEQRNGMSSYEFSCQVLLEPVAKGTAYFDMGWRRYYTGSPREEAHGKRIHIFCDLAKGTAEDYTIIRVLGLGADKLRYELDLYRERMGLADFMDFLFGMEPEELKREENFWKPRVGVVPLWKQRDANLVVWIEEFGASAWVQAVKMEMERRKFRFRVRELSSNRRKESRIAALQVPYRNGEFLYPERGFGHGSKGDPRDTMEQFFQDEYRLYSYGGEGVLNDDMLDTEAWCVQPEVAILMPFPDPMGMDIYGLSPGDPHYQSWERDSFAAASAWVA